MIFSQSTCSEALNKHIKFSMLTNIKKEYFAESFYWVIFPKMLKKR